MPVLITVVSIFQLFCIFLDHIESVRCLVVQGRWIQPLQPAWVSFCCWVPFGLSGIIFAVLSGSAGHGRLPNAPESNSLAYPFLLVLQGISFLSTTAFEVPGLSPF